MAINFLRPAHTSIIKTTFSVLLIELLLGISFHLVLTNQWATSSAPTKSEETSSLYYPVVNVIPINFCETNAIHKTICDSAKIDPLLKAKILGTSNTEDLFPKKLRVVVKEGFKPGPDFPTNRYPHSSTMYSVTLSSLDELAALSEVEEVENIKEFGTVELN